MKSYYKHLTSRQQFGEKIPGIAETKKIDIHSIARSLKYKTYMVTTKNELENILRKIKKIKGPILILIKISKSKTTSKRVDIDAVKIKQRFMTSLKNNV